MLDIKEVLLIRFDPADLLVMGDMGISRTAQSRLERVGRQLRDLRDRHPGYALPDEHRQKEAYELFMRLAPEGLSRLLRAFDSSSAARRLAWALCLQPDNRDAIVDNIDLLNLAVGIIRERKRPSMVPPLFYALMRTWHRQMPASMLRGMLTEVVDLYEEGNRRARELADRKKYFLQADGAKHAAKQLLSDEIGLSGGVSRLGLPELARYSAYYGEVASEYTIEGIHAGDFEDTIRSILDFLQVDDRKPRVPAHVVRRCLVPIIIRLSYSGESSLRERVQRAAFIHIGDPANEARWRPWRGATQADKEAVEEARKILSSWIVQRFITAFFDKIVIDTDRRLFWMRYAQHITRFKVYTDSTTRTRLRQDELLRPYLDGRCGDMTSTGQSALLMQIKDRVVVEFSHKGAACYIHKSGSPLSPSFNKASYSQQELTHYGKVPNLFRLRYGEPYEMYDSGRLIHNGGWQNGLRVWFETALDITADEVAS